MVDLPERAILYYRLPGSIPTKRRWARLIISRFGSLERFLETFRPEPEGDFIRAYQSLLTPRPEERDKITLWRERYNLVVLGEEGYPESLLQLPEPPIFLFSLGGKVEELAKPRVVIVGTRNPSPYGARMTETLTAQLVELGASIGSGLARGVDGIAHRTALDHSGQTWAVLAHGCDTIYPPEHGDLARRILDQGGILLSEYPPETPMAVFQFPERNRILAGLSDGVVVIEGSAKSGSLITAEWAIELGREVFALPGRVGDPFAEGPLKLLQSGAHLAINGEEILRALGWTTPAKVTLPPRIELPPEQKTIWETLSPVDPIHVDLLSDRLGLPVQELLSVLLDMELKGFVQALPGKLYLRSVPKKAPSV